MPSTRSGLQTATTNPGNLFLKRIQYKTIKAKQDFEKRVWTWSRRSDSLAVIRPLSGRKPVPTSTSDLTELELIGHFVRSKLCPISHRHNKVKYTAGLFSQLCHNRPWHNHTNLSMQEEIEPRSARWVRRGNLTSWAPCQNLHNHKQSSTLCKFNQSDATQPATRLRTNCHNEPCG